MKFRLILGFLGVFTAFVSFYETADEKRQKSDLESQWKEQKSKMKHATLLEKHDISLSVDEKALFSHLSPKFELNISSISGEGILEHSHWATEKQQNSFQHLPKPTLSASMTEKGKLYLHSHFYGKNRLGHTHISIQVAGEAYDSTYVPNYFPLQEHAKRAVDEVFETLTYEGDKDLLLLDKIADNVEKEIIVKMFGEKGYHEFTLGFEEKKAIRESVLFARLLEV